MHIKELSDSDLGLGGSHQTHIGLHEDMLKSWSLADKVYGTYLFVDGFENCYTCTATINAIEDGNTGRPRSPKIKTGDRSIPDDQNLLKLIRSKATKELRHLSLFELPDGVLIAYLSKGSADLEKTLSTTPPSNYTSTLLKNLDHSLICKPFTILTGASGTGKTKLAISLANYLGKEDSSNIATIAVGADWTDNRNVLGFVNHLRTLEDKPIYQSTLILDLILRANQDPNYPYFLILDEMNLSHVERYFSDFLSTMEQTDGSLELHKEGEDKLLRFEGDELKVPHRIEYPKNLFVIGTVNIDETTYMFSPKVLDRANVIEFTVSEGEIGEFLKDPQPYQEIEPAELGIAEGFLELAKQAQNGKLGPLPEANNEAIAAHMLNLFKILKDGRFEFAYRTAKEVNTYLRVCRHLADDSDAWDAGTWNEDLDDQILQKLLPKLHGSMGRIGGLLAALAAYCHKSAIEAETAQAQTKIQLDAALQFGEGDAAFPKSLKKLQAMIQTLRDEQFVSFIQ